MKNFILKCVLFMIPILGLFAFPFAVYLLGGEFVPVPTILDRQWSSDKEVLYDSAFSYAPAIPYKILGTVRTDPEILALGLSRVLTIQSDFFKDPSVFYNAGSAVHIAPDLLTFMDRAASDTKLRVVLFDASNLLFDNPSDHIQDQSSLYDMLHQFLSSGWRQVYIDYADGSFSLSDLFQSGDASSSYIGLAAMRDHKGFRKDGSLDYGDAAELDKSKAALPSDIADNVLNTTLAREPHFSADNLAAIDQFLSICKQRGIYVIGYMSPYASEIYRKEQSLNDPAGIYKTEPAYLSVVLKKYGFPFYDLKDLATIGSSDAELYNSIHSSGKGTLKLLRYLSEREPRLSDYLDARSLESRIAREAF